jgi:hypothetical protein
MNRSGTQLLLTIAASVTLSLPSWAGPFGAGIQQGAAQASGRMSAQAQAAADALRGQWRGALEQTKVYGRTYGEWGNEWWAWAQSAPDGQNPVQDSTGAYCGVNQPSGNVWFLAGTFGGSVQRSCTIPRGRALFYPLLNIHWVDCPGTSDVNVPEADIRNLLASVIDLTTAVTTSLNDVPVVGLQVPIVRTQGPRFSTVLPANNVIAPSCNPPLPAGRTGRQISEGYWVMLPPLPPGHHVLKLRGALPWFGTAVEYHLTVQ